LSELLPREGHREARRVGTSASTDAGANAGVSIPADPDLPPPASARGAMITAHLANERTYLAWLRTSIAMVRLGIAMNLLSLYLAETRVKGTTGGVVQTSLLDTERVGSALVLLGVAVMLWAAIHFVHVRRAIESGSYRPSIRSIWVLTACVLVLGLFALTWLLFP